LVYFGPPCKNALANVEGSTPECALHIEPHLEALRKIEMLADARMRPPPVLEFLTPPAPAHQRPMNPRGGRGRHVGRRVAEISLKNHQNANIPH